MSTATPAPTTDRPARADAPTRVDRAARRASPHDDATAAFLHVRTRLLGIAHRITGNRAEAEDVVQDAWLRWQRYDRSTVVDPTAFLVTTTTRLAINEVSSARFRRAVADDPWRPESADPTADPTLRVERREALEGGIQVLLERLAPAERVAYLLRHAFDYPYRRIAEVLHTSEVNARQIVSRAGRRLASGRRRPVGASEHRRLVQGFDVVARTGDVTALQDLLAGDPAA